MHKSSLKKGIQKCIHRTYQEQLPERSVTLNVNNFFFTFVVSLKSANTYLIYTAPIVKIVSKYSFKYCNLFAVMNHVSISRAILFYDNQTLLNLTRRDI